MHLELDLLTLSSILPGQDKTLLSGSTEKATLSSFKDKVREAKAYLYLSATERHEKEGN
jgi:hypothetical protein